MSLSPSLGMWKDSAIDLASMVKAKESSEMSEDGESSNAQEHETSEVSLGLTRDSFLNLAGLAKKTSSTESVKAVHESNHSMSSTSSGLPPSDTSVEDASDTRYSAFDQDYSDYADYAMEYNVDPYAPTVFGSKQGNGEGFWCCLFAPWFGGKKGPDKIEESYDDDNNEASATHDAQEEKLEAPHDRDETSSTGSEMYGEKLTDQDRLAAMARLRVAEIDHFEKDLSSPRRLTAKELTELPYKNVPFDSQTAERHPGLEMEKSSEEKTPEKGDESPKKLRPILKTGNSSRSLTTTPKSKEEPGQRRALFATTYEKKSSPKKQHARFAPMARVITIKSCNEMTFMEKSSIWWQKSDYNSFKKAGRLIAKAMMEGGSEIWLANPPSSKTSQQLQRSKTDSEAIRSYHLSDRTELRQDPGDESSPESFGNKWWCKFGHSRRGLEHIASMDEGRQRQANVKQAVKAVLDEQRRQRLHDNEDPEKLRKIELQHTLWARDLALAAGAADAESVRSNFSDGAKSREFYLLKQASASPGKSRPIPAFMDPTSSSPKFDANTSSQIRFRRVSLSVATQAEEKKEDVSKMEAIHDTSSNHSCISRKAAAFGTETKDMAAVLSGMGAVSDRDVDPALA